MITSPEAFYARIDTELAALLATADPAAPLVDPWLALQNQLMAGVRRGLSAPLGLVEGQRLLDAGCGYGLAALEAAGVSGAQVLGIDVAGDKLEVARRLHQRLGAGLPVHWHLGDLARLPLPDASVDAATSQLVFQHLTEPARAAAELLRVLRPGGRLLIFDVDDGYDLDWPLRSGPEAELQDMVRGLQRSLGGDREIGRKLPELLTQAGFTVTGVQVLVQGGYGADPPETRHHLALRYASARAGALAAGVLTAARYDALVEALAMAPARNRFASSGQVVCLAVRP